MSATRIEYSPWPANTPIPDENCPICRDPLRSDENVEVVGHNIAGRVNELFHLVHERCLNSWQRTLLGNNQELTCPVCRTPVVAPAEAPPLLAPFSPNPLPEPNFTVDRFEIRVHNLHLFTRHCYEAGQLRAAGQPIPDDVRWSIIRFAALEEHNLDIVREFLLPQDQIPDVDRPAFIRALLRHMEIDHQTRINPIETAIHQNDRDFLHALLTQHAYEFDPDEILHMLSDAIFGNKPEMLDTILQDLQILDDTLNDAIILAVLQTQREMVVRLLRLKDGEEIGSMQRGRIIASLLRSERGGSLSDAQRQIIIDVVIQDGPIGPTMGNEALRAARRRRYFDIHRAIMHNFRRQQSSTHLYQ